MQVYAYCNDSYSQEEQQLVIPDTVIRWKGWLFIIGDFKGRVAYKHVQKKISCIQWYMKRTKQLCDKKICLEQDQIISNICC